MNDNKIDYHQALDNFQIDGQSASQLMGILKGQLRGLTRINEDKFGVLANIDTSDAVMSLELDELEAKIKKFLELFEDTKEQINFACSHKQVDTFAANCCLRAKIIVALCRKSLSGDPKLNHLGAFKKMLRENLTNEQKRDVPSLTLLELYEAFLKLKEYQIGSETNVLKRHQQYDLWDYMDGKNSPEDDQRDIKRRIEAMFKRKIKDSLS